jgi:hypothetical protein
MPLETLETRHPRACATYGITKRTKLGVFARDVRRLKRLFTDAFLAPF